MTIGTLFLLIFGCLIMLYIIWFVIWFGLNQKKRSKLKPVQYTGYNKSYFEKDFTFSCEHCGSIVSTKQTNCIKCGSSYGDNKVYIEKKRAINQNYMHYLYSQDAQLSQEEEYINNTLNALRTNIIWKNTIYNFQFPSQNFPTYIPKSDFDFTCEYCNTKLRGRSNDSDVCLNCGASYSNNLELLVREKEDAFERHQYEYYLKLKEFQQKQNTINEQKDAAIMQKHGKKVNFLMKHGRWIALLILFLAALLCLVLAIIIYFALN